MRKIISSKIPQNPNYKLLVLSLTFAFFFFLIIIFALVTESLISMELQFPASLFPRAGEEQLVEDTMSEKRELAGRIHVCVPLLGWRLIVTMELLICCLIKLLLLFCHPTDGIHSSSSSSSAPLHSHERVFFLLFEASDDAT